MDEVVNYVIQVPVFQRQLFQLLAERKDFFRCELFVYGRGSCAGSIPVRLAGIDYPCK
ncbi:MAG: hypothetical protein ACE5FQ_08405 [Thiogranum sp.]